MNINDYTYHLCDRFILLFVAFVGIVGTSYILVNLEKQNNHSSERSIYMGMHHQSQDKKINNYTITLSAAPTVIFTQNKNTDNLKDLAVNSIQENEQSN